MAWQFNSRVIWAIDNKFAARLGTWSTEDKAMDGVTKIEPLPEIGDKEPLATLI